jgi:hypothetical protein
MIFAKFFSNIKNFWDAFGANASFEISSQNMKICILAKMEKEIFVSTPVNEHSCRQSVLFYPFVAGLKR